MVAIWALSVVGLVVSGAPRLDATGDLEVLLPGEHRTPEGRGLLLLRHDGSVPADELASQADRVHDALGQAWVPIAAPSAEVTGWLDAHALYLLPLSTHAELETRLSDESIRRAVEGLRANMSSPFFGLTTAESRRDPLRLREMTTGAQGQALWSAPSIGRKSSPTPAGDLLAHDGRSMLIEYRSHRPMEALVEQVRGVVDPRMRVDGVGAEASRSAAASAATKGLHRAVLATLAGIAIVLATALRRVRQAAAILACLSSGALVCSTFIPLDPVSTPIALLALGFACEGALHLQRISERGWPGALVLGTALAPLYLSAYPLWRRWSWTWLVVVLTLLLLLRVVLPALLAVLRCDTPWERRGFVLRPMPALAVLLSAGLLAAGAWATTELRFRGSDRLDFGIGNPLRTLVVETYFEPGLVARATTVASDETEALTRAADDARLLHTLVPTEARLVDTPGALVLPEAELQRRRVGLAELALGERLGKLRDALETRGFRPDAFGEFLRSASDPDQLPTPAAALDGPLSRWIGRYLSTQDDTVRLESQVHLDPDPQVLPPPLETADARVLELVGPAIGGRRQAAGFQDWLGIFALVQLWLAAFVVWLGTRSFPVALAAGLAGLSTQTGVLAAMVPLGLPLSPAMLPVLLLAGAAASIAAGRACRAVDSRTPLFATGLLVVSACQGVAALALIASAIPVWTQVGYVAAIGAVLASGTGLFVAPGLARMLRPLGKDAPAEDER